MSELHSYPKIFNLGHPQIDALFSDPVVVEEKVDGSQFSFGRRGQDLFCRSKGAVINVDAPDNMFAAGVETCKELFQHLPDGWVFRGEYLAKPKHNALAYDRIPDRHIAIFDIETEPNRFMDAASKRQWVGEHLDLEVVPHVYSGMVTSLDQVLSFMDSVSFLGGQEIEGLVFKSLTRFGPDGKALMGKHVSEAFKEVHKGAWKEANPGQGDIIMRLIMGLRTPARWNKAIQHLRDRGELTHTPKDIGPLLREVHVDLEAECADEIKAVLYKWAIGDIKRGAVRGLPEFYKEQLAASQFGTENA